MAYDECQQMMIAMNGPIPTMFNRQVTWSATFTRRFWVQRFLLTPCEGRLMASSIKIANQEMLAENPLDLHLIGDPNLFGMRLEFPTVEPGMVFRVNFEWVPPPMIITMSRAELKKRRKSGDWSVSWHGVSMRIDGDHASDVWIPKKEKYGVQGFTPWPQPLPRFMLLAKVDLNQEGHETSDSVLSAVDH